MPRVTHSYICLCLQNISKAQFYKQNHRWVEGLVSAARAVGTGASVLVDTADGTLRGDNKLGVLLCTLPLSLSHDFLVVEEMMVCGQEIAASTAQLVSASRVKAATDSKSKAKLELDSSQGQSDCVITAATLRHHVAL